MMRSAILLIFFFMPALVFAQKKQEAKDYSTQDISVMEQRSRGKAVQKDAMRTTFAASQNFDVQYYRAEWEVDPAVNYIRGKVTMYYKMNVTGSKIILDLSQALTVNAVKQRTASLINTHANSELEIIIPVTNQGVLDSLTIDYEGAPISGGVGSFIVATHGNSGDPAIPVIWTLSEPFGSMDWWPCKNGLDDKADLGVDIFITHPTMYNGQTYKAAANGLLKSETDIGNGKTRTHWKHGYPIASYLVCFAVTNYTVFTNSVLIDGSSLPMLTYCYPESVVSFQEGTQNALDALQYFSGIFGNYPFLSEKYGHVQFGWGGGMEHQTCSFMVSLNENLVAHELAHQWFGDKITCASWEDVWLNEGFATHLANMYRENKYPNNKISIRSDEVAYITSVTNGSVKVDNLTSVNRIFNSRLSYNKGSHLLYMLRLILTDVVFFQGVNNYLSDASLSYKFATTADLKAHLEAVGGQDLTYFFDQWFEGQGYPTYNIEWQPNGNNVNFKIKQTTSDASVGFFQLPVPLLFRNNTTNQEKLIVVNNTANNQNFTETLGFVAETVTIDPEYWLISKGNTTTKLNDPLPVRFSQVGINCVGEYAELNWSTTFEENASVFEIRKSVNAVDWTIIGKVDAAGNSQNARNYIFTDSELALHSNYYQIISYDLDGTSQPTRILEKNCALDTPIKITILPNPVGERLVLSFEEVPSIKFAVQIFNQNGQILKTQIVDYDIMIKQGLDVSRISAGLYLLRILDQNGNTYSTSRFVKK